MLADEAAFAAQAEVDEAVIADDDLLQAQELVERVRASDDSALDQLHRYFESYVLWYLENLERVSLYLNEWRYLTGERLERVIAQRRTYERFIRELIERAQDEGSVDDSLDVKYATFFILGAVNGVPTWYRRKGQDAPQRIARAYADMIVGTLTATSPREAGAPLR